MTIPDNEIPKVESTGQAAAAELVAQRQGNKNTFGVVSQLSSPVLIAGCGLLLGVVADGLFNARPLGISVPLMTLVILITLFVLARLENITITRSNLWLVIPLLFMSTMFAVRAAPLLLFLNFTGALIMLLLLANRFQDEPLINLNLGGYALAVIATSLSLMFLPATLLLRSGKSLTTTGGQNAELLKRILVGVLIALPFLCIFTALFASADLVFGKYVENILYWFELPRIISHTFLTLLLSWPLMGGLTYALVRDKNDIGPDDANVSKLQNINAKVRFLGMLETSIILFSIDVLFAIFVAIQFAALFGGEAFIRSQGLTYSEYARQGFFELVFVAVITLLLILGLDFVARRESDRHHSLFVIGSGLMISMTIIMLISAFLRMNLYELVYGFTRLRLHTHVFMVWLAILLAAFFVLIWLKRTRLFATAFLAFSLGFIATLNVINPDVFIVRQNLNRYFNGEELDADYLGTLSADAVPELMPLLTDYGTEVADEIGPRLRTQLFDLGQRDRKAGWMSYHVSSTRAYALLDQQREILKEYDMIYGYRYDDFAY